MYQPATKQTNDLIKPKRVYLINAIPEPFTDEDWFRDAKQHESYDPDRLPAMQITQLGGANIEDIAMRGGKINEPNTPISVCMNYVTGKYINRPQYGWLCLSENHVYYHATYQDVGLVHRSGRVKKNSMICRSFSRRSVRTRRYYLIPVPNRVETLAVQFDHLADRLAEEMIRHAFG